MGPEPLAEAVRRLGGDLLATSSETYTYDPLGRTTGIADTTKNTSASYTYDASSNLLLQKDTIAGNTSTILYLPGEQLYLNSSRGITAQRSYDTGGGPTVIRDNTGILTYEASASQGSGTLTISSALANQTRRSYTPYGTARGTTPTNWVDGNGYLGQPTDPATNLSLLGARMYDPATGHFLQRDPILEATDPNQLGGYTYASDDPVNGSDPNGLMCVQGVDSPGCGGPGGGTGTGGGGGTTQDNGGQCTTQSCYYHFLQNVRKVEAAQADVMNQCHDDANCYRHLSSEMVVTTDGTTQTTNNKAAQAESAYVQAVAKQDQIAGHKSSCGGWSWLCDTGKFIWKHRNTIATVIAAGACLSPGFGWVTCGVLSALALGVRVQQRAEDEGGFQKTWRADLVDTIFTAGTLGANAALRFARYGSLAAIAKADQFPGIWTAAGRDADHLAGNIYQLAGSVPNATHLVGCHIIKCGW